MGDEESFELEPVSAAAFVPPSGSGEIKETSSMNESLEFEPLPGSSGSVSPGIIAPPAVKCRRGGRAKRDTAGSFLVYKNYAYDGIRFPALVCMKTQTP